MALRILLKAWDSGQAEFQLRFFSELALVLTIVVHIGQEKSKLSAGFSLHDRDPMFMYILKDISTAFQLRNCYYAPIDFKKRGSQLCSMNTKWPTSMMSKEGHLLGKVQLSGENSTRWVGNMRARGRLSKGRRPKPQSIKILPEEETLGNSGWIILTQVLAKLGHCILCSEAWRAGQFMTLLEELLHDNSRWWWKGARGWSSEAFWGSPWELPTQEEGPNTQLRAWFPLGGPLRQACQSLPLHGGGKHRFLSKWTLRLT